MISNVNVNEETKTNTDEIISVEKCLGSVLECFNCSYGEYEDHFDEKTKLYNWFKELSQKSMKDILDELKNTQTEVDEISASIWNLTKYTHNNDLTEQKDKLVNRLFLSFLSKFGWNYGINEIDECCIEDTFKENLLKNDTPFSPSLGLLIICMGLDLYEDWDEKVGSDYEMTTLDVLFDHCNKTKLNEFISKFGDELNYVSKLESVINDNSSDYERYRIYDIIDPINSHLSEEFMNCIDPNNFPPMSN
jgi:hypothetical protein